MELHIDLETYSEEDIKNGVHKYVDHPSFEILLMAFAVDNDDPMLLDFTEGDQVPLWLSQAVTRMSDAKLAHNAGFEITCLNKQFGWGTDASQWIDTAVMAAELGLPRALGPLTTVLKFNQDRAKDKKGKQLITYFCKPCAPTKVNGGRTRNLPHHAPEKWAEFKEYCKQDVVAERAVHRNLLKLWIDPVEWDNWRLDQVINNRGIKVDMDMVDNVLGIKEEMTKDLMRKSRIMTGLNNPNSTAQLKPWLERELGLEIPNMQADTVKELIANAPEGSAKEVLKMRRMLSKSSIKKYDALKKATCSDGRIRGTLLFYGSRTGRWAGRVFQPQNLPRNYLDDLDSARTIFREHDYETAQIVYDDVADTMAQLVRTVVIPSDGKKFIVADFSAVEARCLAWFANEKWRLDVFRGDGKIYEASASEAFDIPIESVTKGSPWRAQGKVLELACLTGDTLVLTEKYGWKELRKVTLDTRVWDGVEWVYHGGLVCRGKKEVITYDTLTATPDHLVWVEGQSEPIQFGEAAAKGLRLLRPNARRKDLWPCDDNQPRKDRKETSTRPGEVLHVRRSEMDELIESAPRRIERMPKVFPAKTGSEETVQGHDHGKAEMHQPHESAVRKLRGSWYHVRLRFGERILRVDLDALRPKTYWERHRQSRQRKRLLSWEPTVRDQVGEQLQPESIGDGSLGPEGVAVRSNYSYPEVKFGDDTRASVAGCSDGCSREEKELEAHTAVVYDLLNCGPRHCFVANGILVHNCGYGGSKGAIAAMDYDNAIPEADRKPLVDKWRAASPKIVEFWWRVGNAAIKAVTNNTTVILPHPFGGNLKLAKEKGFLFITLPSGRRLAYPRPMMWEGKYGPELSYEGQDQQTRKWTRIGTYGPKLVENIVQATCRDLLMYGMTQLELCGYPVVMHVHDEAIVEVDPDVTVEEIEKILALKPGWAKHMPHVADGFETMYYKKD